MIETILNWTYTSIEFHTFVILSLILGLILGYLLGKKLWGDAGIVIKCKHCGNAYKIQAAEM